VFQLDYDPAISTYLSQKIWPAFLTAILHSFSDSPDNSVAYIVTPDF
jgi:hypothetical protein